MSCTLVDAWTLCVSTAAIMFTLASLIWRVWLVLPAAPRVASPCTGYANDHHISHYPPEPPLCWICTNSRRICLYFGEGQFKLYPHLRRMCTHCDTKNETEQIVYHCDRVSVHIFGRRCRYCTDESEMNWFREQQIKAIRLMDHYIDHGWPTRWE